MLHHKFLLTGAVAVVIGLGAGCEWSGTSSEESWNDAYSWANFSGTYNLYNVLDPTDTTTEDRVTVTEGQGNIRAGARDYTLDTAHYPIVPTSVSVHVGDYTANDNGTAVLSGAGVSGTITYGTGNGSVNLVSTPDTTDIGKPITITYTYLVSGTVTTPGSEITHFTVNQQGNLLTFTDNNGVAYGGRVTGANVPSDSKNAGSVRLNFQVKSSKATIVGTLSGDWSGGTTGTLSNRSLLGTYSAQGGVDVDIQGASGSISITPLPVTTN
jgi:hypothetical protein